MNRLATLCALLFLLALTPNSEAEDWPQFRGPTGQGIYEGKNLPLEWSTTKNVVWKQPLPGQGWSSPIVLDGRVYLTAAVPVEGKPKDWSLKAICVDAKEGRILWQTDVFQQDGSKSPRIHTKNSHASPTPVSDGKRLYVHFGHQGSAALDLDGKILWRNTELRYAPVHGNGGSQVLGDGRLIFSCDGADKQFVAALDSSSGKVLWNTSRKSEASRKFSFSTPLLIEVGGKKQVVSPASDVVVGYDAENGDEIWRVKYDGYSVIPRPVFGHGMVFLSTGYDYPALLAIRVEGTGDVTKSHVVWKAKKGAPNAPSPLLVGDELYLISDFGTASCFDAKTGKLYWQQERIGDAFSASPLYAAGRLYLQSEDGVTTVLRAGTKFERLAQNRLDEKTYASFAAADGAIYLRTERHLYSIQEK